MKQFRAAFRALSLGVATALLITTLVISEGIRPEVLVTFRSPTTSPVLPHDDAGPVMIAQAHPQTRFDAPGQSLAPPVNQSQGPIQTPGFAPRSPELIDPLHSAPGSSQRRLPPDPEHLTPRLPADHAAEPDPADQPPPREPRSVPPWETQLLRMQERLDKLAQDQLTRDQQTLLIQQQATQLLQTLEQNSRLDAISRQLEELRERTRPDDKAGPAKTGPAGTKPGPASSGPQFPESHASEEPAAETPAREDAKVEPVRKPATSSKSPGRLPKPNPLPAPAGLSVPEPVPGKDQSDQRTSAPVPPRSESVDTSSHKSSDTRSLKSTAGGGEVPNLTLTPKAADGTAPFVNSPSPAPPPEIYSAPSHSTNQRATRRWFQPLPRKVPLRSPHPGL